MNSFNNLQSINKNEKADNGVFFSIICPVYNAETFILDSVGSVIKQSFTNWELIIIDDGSTDSSAEICDNLCLNDKRLKVIHKNNEGQSKARYEGMKNAKGKYLLFLDSDDKYREGALNFIHESLVKSDVDFLVYNANVVSGLESKSLYNLNLVGSNHPLVECFCKRKISYLWSICFKKSLFLLLDQDVLNRFISLTYSEDCYLIYNMLKHVKREKFSILDKELYSYIKNSGSITSNQNASRLFDRFFVFNHIYEDIFLNFHNFYVQINKMQKDEAGWTYLSSAKRMAFEYDYETFLTYIKIIRKSFLFKRFNKFRKDKYNFVAYILLKLKMYSCFRKYIIKHERLNDEN